MKEPIRVLLADDHPVVLHGLKEYLRSEGDMEIVGEATNGTQALELIQTMSPQVAVVDVSMPGLNGITLARRVAADCPGVRVVLLTGQEDDTYLIQALQARVNGYVLKRSAVQSLVHAIRAAAIGGTYIDPAIAGQALRSALAAGPTNVKSARQLTRREIDVLRLAAHGETNKEIARHMGLSVKTVESFKARAMSKAGLRSRAEIVKYAIAQSWFGVE
jgi:DNA-binding NarL/FixJ family response regulator